MDEEEGLITIIGPGTPFSAAYTRPADPLDGLVESGVSVVDYPNPLMTLDEFRKLALATAHEMAITLGWVLPMSPRPQD